MKRKNKRVGYKITEPKEVSQRAKVALQEICEKVGHQWETYTVSTGTSGSNDIEQAGYCKVCGYDTHEKYWE